MLVGFTGGNTAHFLEGIESNQRYLRPGGNIVWSCVSPAWYSIAMTTFTWRHHRYGTGFSTPQESTWGYIIFGTAASSSSHRKFVLSSKVTMTSCSWQRRRYRTQFTVTTAWGMMSSAPTQQSPHPNNLRWRLYWSCSNVQRGGLLSQCASAGRTWWSASSLLEISKRLALGCTYYR